jgi:hypothetical protein
MDSRHVLGVIVLVAVVGAGVAVSSLGSPSTGPLDSDQQYPPGTGPDEINFSTLTADDANVSHTPREYWDAYRINYTEPPDRQRVEGEYYINSQTGEIIGERWDDGIVYLNGSTYAFAEDPMFVYDNATDAYYRYDPVYGAVVPTNIGRHTGILEDYSWKAANTTTHHGVPVITYWVTGKRSESDVLPAINGMLQLGVEDRIIYAFDITLNDGERNYQYTYDVRPAPFPDHDWVETAREISTDNTTANR